MEKLSKDLNQINNILEEAFTKEKYYIVDFIPFSFPNEDYARFENYLDKNYKKQFSKKIIFILYSLMFYYNSHLYLEWDIEEPPFLQYHKKDLRNCDLDKLDELISNYILKNRDGIYLLFKNSENENSVMCVQGGYDVQFYNIKKKTKTYINELIKSQGLFLKGIAPDIKSQELFDQQDSTE